MFKVLVVQTLYTLSDDQTEYPLKDRRSFMRFVGLALHDPVPDAKTIWLDREQLARAGATERLFARFDALLRAKGWLAMGGQIVDATVIEARRPRLTRAQKDIIKGGGVPAEWKPARRAQIDRDGGWTIKRGKRREAAPGDGPQRQVEIAVPAFGYQNHVGIDREHGFLRRYTITHAATYDGGQLGAVLDRDDAGAHRPRQCHPSPGARARRARLCRPEMPARAPRPHRRYGPRPGQDRPRQSRLQLLPARLAQRPNHPRMTKTRWRGPPVAQAKRHAAAPISSQIVPRPAHQLKSSLKIELLEASNCNLSDSWSDT
jgi:IS5 family transposase